MGVQVAKFIDLREGVTANQFTIGDREKIESISDLDPMYKRLMDEPIACVMAVMGGIGRPNLTPMWFDYEGDKVLVNVAEHRKKTKWIKDNPQILADLGMDIGRQNFSSVESTLGFFEGNTLVFSI